MTNKKYTEELILTAKTFKVLKNPVRLHILKTLSKMNSCCYSNDISKKLNISPSTLSQHLKELKHAGLIVGEIQAPYIKYCINKENWEKSKKIIRQFFNKKIELNC